MCPKAIHLATVSVVCISSQLLNKILPTLYSIAGVCAAGNYKAKGNITVLSTFSTVIYLRANNSPIISVVTWRHATKLFPLSLSLSHAHAHTHTLPSHHHFITAYFTNYYCIKYSHNYQFFNYYLHVNIK